MQSIKQQKFSEPPQKISMRLEPKVAKQLREYARKNNQSINKAVNELVRSEIRKAIKNDDTTGEEPQKR